MKPTPTLEEIDQKLGMVIEMLTALVQALAEDAEEEHPILTLDGTSAGRERDGTMAL